MLDFLKKIFKNEAEQEAKQLTEIRLQHMKSWLNEKSKPLTEELKHQIEDILMKVNEEIERGRFNIEVLEHAKLQNPNIPFKAKQYMEGNRKAYIKSINSFLGHMEINNKDYFYLLDFCREFDELLNDLNKGTVRSYTILQEFFANETNKIAQNLKNFDILFSELKSALNNERMVKVNNTMKRIENLEAKSKQKINIDVDLRNMEASLRLANEEKDAIMSDIMSFSKSEAHTNFLNLNEQKKNKEKEFYQNQDSILQSFSVIDRPLRKYSHIAFDQEELILDYLKNPIETLASDKELKILEILKNLEKMLNENQIHVDEKKKEKTLEEIKKLNKEFIEQFQKKYLSFKSDMENIETKIKETKVSEKMKELSKKLEDTNFSIEKNSEEFNRLKGDAEKLNNSISNLKNEIESSTKEIFNEYIRIVA